MFWLIYFFIGICFILVIVWALWTLFGDEISSIFKPNCPKCGGEMLPVKHWNTTTDSMDRWSFCRECGWRKDWEVN